jgi:2-aminoadipate transaminase
VKPRLLYTIPVFQNPRASTIPETERKNLAKLAHEFNFVVAADEVYELLPFPGIDLKQMPGPLFYYNLQPEDPDIESAGNRRHGKHHTGSNCHSSAPSGPLDHRGDGKLVSMGSFSKILSPGMRLGWLQAPASVLQRIKSCGVVESGGALNPFVSTIVHSAIELGLLDEHVEHVRRTLASRSKTLCDMLESTCPEGCEFTVPTGGYFVWMKLPDPVHCERLLDIASTKHKVKVNILSRTLFNPWVNDPQFQTIGKVDGFSSFFQGQRQARL